MKKNIYLIVSDQHSAAAFSAWGNNEVKTPNLDALAGVSFNFPNTYCPAPICGPSRFALLSGRHVHRCGAYDNGSSIPYDTPTLGHLMTNAGFRSVLCGRMHIHGPDHRKAKHSVSFTAFIPHIQISCYAKAIINIVATTR